MLLYLRDKVKNACKISNRTMGNQNTFTTSHLHPSTMAWPLLQDPGFSRAAKGFNSLTQTEKCSYWIYWTFGLNRFLRLPKYKSLCSGPWELACCCGLQKSLAYYTMLSATQECRYYKTFSSDCAEFPASTYVSGKETKPTFSGSRLGRWLQYLSGES